MLLLNYLNTKNPSRWSAQPERNHIEEASLEWPCLRKDTHSQIGVMDHFCQRSKTLIPAFSHREKERGRGPEMAPGKFLIPG